MEYTSTCQEETINLGKGLSYKLGGGEVILLHGDLGAGKTTFVKGLAEGIGVDDVITSPTFSLMNVYSVANKELGIKNLVHIDTYRMESDEDLVEIGIEDYLCDSETVCIIEWPEKVRGLLKDIETIDVSFEHVGDGVRKLVIGE